MILRFALFLTVMTTLVVVGHVYLYRRLVRDAVVSRRARWAGGVVVVVLALLLVGGRFLQRVVPGPLSQAVGTVAYVWMGASLFLVLALMFIGTGRRGLALLDRVRGRPAPPVDDGRRLFLSRAVAGSAIVASGAVSGYGIWRAYAAPVVSEVAVRLPGLPRALDGFSIVQLTDVHVGNIIERRFMDELVRRANALRPDLFAITGDLVDGQVPELGQAVAALADLKSRFGSFFVTGNHDYYSGDVEWSAFLQGLGIEVLRNRHVSIGDRGGSFDLVGVDDWSQRGRGPGSGYDLEAALAGRAPDRGAVLLAHQPANFKEAARRGVGLQLSGHTHGGQLFPLTVLVGLGWEYTAGLYREQDAHIYVGRGCGFWGPPMRVGSPPELVKVVLTV